MNLEEYKIELLSDFDELINFYTGKDKMDDFLHNHLQDCEEVIIVRHLCPLKSKQHDCCDFRLSIRLR